tara:strand:- start:292 stop:903 length:612 start_codon:yes stop_codon:yes gene_type:complete
MYTQHVHKNDRFGYVMDSATDDKRLAGSNIQFPWSSPVGDRLKMKDVCWYKPGMLNKIGKEGKTSWDSLTYFLLMSHNVYQHIESVQRANELTDAANMINTVNHKHWRKLKSASKEEQFSPWVPRNCLYITQFIDQLFKSETPYQMLEEAAPMLADFNGKKSLASSADSFSSLFETQEVQNDVIGEFSTEQEDEAEKFLQEVS